MTIGSDVRGQLGRAAAVGAWIATLVAAIAGLEVAGRGSLRTPPLTSATQLRLWMVSRSPEATMFAALRLIVLAMAWYLAVTSVLDLAARLSRVASLIRAVDLVTLPSVRRLVARAVGGAVGVGLAASPIIVAGPPLAGQRPHRPFAHPSAVAVKATPEPKGLPDPGTGDPPPTMRLLAPDAPVQPQTSPGLWIVRKGDHLWGISRATLLAAWGRPPSNRDIVPYWRQVIGANTDRLVHPGDASLIFPGQVLEVPAPPPPPRPDAPAGC